MADIPTNLTPATPADPTQNFDQIADMASVVAGIAAPQFAALIAMSVTLLKVAPHLYIDVMKLVAKADPTQAEKDEINAKLAVMLNPETLYK